MTHCLYDCTVLHRRVWPKRHEFVYRVFLFHLDLDALESLGRLRPWFAVNARGLYSFREADHVRLAPGGLRATMEAFLAANGIAEKPARISLLTNARFLGYTFNPISIWFGFRADGSPLAAIAQVGNTFGELKPFLVPAAGDGFAARCPKLFYVSPFSPLDIEFDFRFAAPSERLAVWIDDYRAGERILVSSLTGRRIPLTARNLLGMTARYPFITLKVIGLIHWQALRLWIKRIPFHRKEESPGQQTGVHRPHRSLTGGR